MAMPVHSEREPMSAARGRNPYFVGMMLIGLGLFFLAAQYFQSETLALMFLPGLGLIFLAGGLSTGNVGLIIPGSILCGIGTGVYLVNGPLAYMGDQANGGIIVLSLAAGFVLITVLSSVLSSRLYWWPLIPASVLSVVGGALLLGERGLTVLTWIGHAWPVALIVAGCAMLVRQRSE